MERKDAATEQRTPAEESSNSRRWCEILDVTPGASAEEIDAAYTRAISLIEGKSVGGYLMLDPASAKAAREDVERAYAELKTSAHAASKDDEPAQKNEASASQSPSAPDEPVGTAEPTGSEERYASGIPRRAMRILAPVISTPPTAGSESAEASTSHLAAPPKPRISIAKPISAPPEPARDAPSSPAEKSGAEIASDDSAKALPSSPPQERPKIKLLPSIPPERAVGEVNVISPPDDVDRVNIRDGDEVNGGLIRRLREDRGISLVELAKTTKVQRSVLVAIEEQDFEALPARVYLRGFLTQIARVLKVDRKRLADGYLAFVQKHGTRSS